MFRAIMVAVVILHLAGCNSTDAPGNPTPGKGEDCVGECKGPHGTKDSVDELPGTGESCTRGLPCDDDDPCTSDDVCVDGKALELPGVFIDGELYPVHAHSIGQAGHGYLPAVGGGSDGSLHLPGDIAG